MTIRPLLAFALVIATPAFARIGDTPEQLKVRFGDPIKEATDRQGSGVRLYRAPNCTELRVRFSNGQSCEEIYKHTAPKAPADFVRTVEQENPGQRICDNANEVHVRTQRPLPERPDHQGGERDFRGVATLREEADTYWIVLRGEDSIVEIPQFLKTHASAIPITPGMEYTATLLDQNSEDMATRLAVVGGREHVDWHDCVDNGTLMQLVRLSAGHRVVFNRAVCEVHSIAMEWRTVKLGYGMVGFSDTESYCIEHFPHHQEYALGGCLADDKKTTSIYVCPKCVAECREYRQKHPD